MDTNSKDKLSNNLVSSMVCMTSKYFGKFVCNSLKIECIEFNLDNSSLITFWNCL